MELDIDFTVPRSKRPFYASIFLILVLLLFTFQIIDLQRELSCDYTEKLMTFYFDWLGISEKFLVLFSTFLANKIPFIWIFSYMVLSDNKFFALLIYIEVMLGITIPQILKVIFQDTRPAWVCTNVDIHYCDESFGWPATHVFHATSNWLMILYFTFIHNGYLNRNKEKLWGKLIRFLGISFCIFVIWLVHQVKIVTGYHFFYQDLHGFLGGAAYFYAMYYWFFPYVMHPDRQFEWNQSIKTSLMIFITSSFCLFGISYSSLLGLDIPQSTIEKIVDSCSLTQDYTLHRFVVVDIFSANGFVLTALAWAFFPLKKTIIKGHFWSSSLLGMPLFGITCYFFTYFSLSNQWSSMLSFWLNFYTMAFILFFSILVEFLYFFFVLKFYSKEDPFTKSNIRFNEDELNNSSGLGMI